MKKRILLTNMIQSEKKNALQNLLVFFTEYITSIIYSNILWNILNIDSISFSDC